MSGSLLRSLLIAVALVLVGNAAPALAKGSKGVAKKAAPSSSKSSKKPADIKLKPDDTDSAGDAAAQSAAPPPTRGPTRIDFDDRLIQGQTNKSGAVYLYDRKELKTRSMIKKRESFRDEIITSVYDN